MKIALVVFVVVNKEMMIRKNQGRLDWNIIMLRHKLVGGSSFRESRSFVFSRVDNLECGE